jgi:hypothetical protein
LRRVGAQPHAHTHEKMNKFPGIRHKVIKLQKMTFPSTAQDVKAFLQISASAPRPFINELFIRFKSHPILGQHLFSHLSYTDMYEGASEIINILIDGTGTGVVCHLRHRFNMTDTEFYTCVGCFRACATYVTFAKHPDLVKRLCDSLIRIMYPFRRKKCISTTDLQGNYEKANICKAMSQMNLKGFTGLRVSPCQSCHN